MRPVSSRAGFLLFCSGFAILAACGGRGSEADLARQGLAGSAAGAPVEASGGDPARRRIIILGDSLTAGLGLPAERSFPALIQERLDREGYTDQVVNAGVSGDTSAGGLRRLEWALGETRPGILVVALGGNDGLRGLPPEQLEKNLAAIIERGLDHGLTVVLAGMEAPPNFGADYTSRFRRVYQTLAARYRVRLIPFLLEGVAGNPSLNQSDGIHPNERGAAVVADLVWKALEPALVRASGALAR
jgi:acyl-CoA thioesterase-1